jgi:acyl homoserine lactone synthase
MPQDYPCQEANMIQLITPECYGEFIDELAAMHRLRFRIFKERLGWDVQVSGDMEVDEFDACHPVYLLQKGDDGRIQGCVRLLPATGRTMLRDTFPALLDGQAAPASDAIWESSRFGLDLCAGHAKSAGGIGRATYELFAGMIEFGPASHGYRHRYRRKNGTEFSIAPTGLCGGWAILDR